MATNPAAVSVLHAQSPAMRPALRAAYRNDAVAHRTLAVTPAQRRHRCRSLVAAAAAGGANEAYTLDLSRGQILRAALVALGGACASASLPAAALAEAAAPAAAAAGLAAEPLAAAAGGAASQAFSKVLLSTLSDCQLAVSVYPTFSYDAAGGGGSGSVRQGADGLLHVSFDTATLNIPPINSRNAGIVGIPIPPPLNIAILPQKLEGTVDPATGRVDLDFLASFEFSAGPIYRAAPLTVATTLTTESSEGPLRSATGQRLQADGHARLVGVARVPRTGDAFLDKFLMLPTDCLAVLSAELRFE